MTNSATDLRARRALIVLFAMLSGASAVSAAVLPAVIGA